MPNYTKITDFAIKDTLTTGDPDKRVRGTEIDAEFEAIETAVATKADKASPTFTGTPVAPTAALDTNTTQLATTAFVQTQITHELNDGIFKYAPVGAVILWYGLLANLPTGWQVCDGTNGTPDMRGRFPIGVSGTYAFDATGGSADSIVVSHTHSFSATTSSDGAHTHDGAFGSGPLLLAGGSVPISVFSGGNATTTSAGTHSHTVSGTTGSTGSSGTGANLPPYRALYFVMKIS